MRLGGLALLLLPTALLGSTVSMSCKTPEPREQASSSSSSRPVLQIPSGRHSALQPQLEPPTSRIAAIDRAIAELETDSSPVGQRRLGVLRVVRGGVECRSLGLEAKLACLERTRDAYRDLLKKDGFSESDRSGFQAEIDDLTRRIGGFGK